MKQPCPSCESKKYFSSWDISPDLLEEMAATEDCKDFVGDEIYKKRIGICKKCSKLLNEMTCASCGCFVQLRARHSGSVCADGKW